jgi:hypothetical protein
VDESSNERRSNFRVFGADKVKEKDSTIELGERQSPRLSEREEFGYAYPTDSLDMVSNEIARRNAASVYAYGLGNSEGVYAAPPPPPGAGLPPTSLSLPSPPSTTTHSSSNEHAALHASLRATLVVPPGYAICQLLPGRTLKMTIRTPRSLRWQPGQYVLLTVPEISKWQSHPYTICNASGNEIVLLVRARKGLTLDLWKAVLRKQRASNDLVKMRVKVSEAMGSTARVEWDKWSTVIIICGGTGVSFGLSILEHMCRRIAIRRRMGGQGPKRVVFIWLMREHGGCFVFFLAPDVGELSELTSGACF